MTIQEVMEQLAEISMLYYDTDATKYDMKESIDDLYDELNGWADAPNK